MHERGRGGRKKFVKLQEPERSQEQQPIPERFPWRQVWQHTMRVRETNEREGERERAGEEQEEGGLLASRFSWWVFWGGAALKRTVGSMMAL